MDWERSNVYSDCHLHKMALNVLVCDQIPIKATDQNFPVALPFDMLYKDEKLKIDHLSGS